jgi:hypothetical protein
LKKFCKKNPQQVEASSTNEYGNPNLFGKIFLHNLVNTVLEGQESRNGQDTIFVIYGRGGFWAIETKSRARVERRDMRGLLSFSKEHPECKPLFLYRGKERLKIENILCLPADEFLCQLHPERVR